MAKKTRSKSNSDAENSSAQLKKTAQIASNETARDVYMKAISSDPQFVDRTKSGEKYGMLGVRPMPLKGSKGRKRETDRIEEKKGDDNLMKERVDADNSSAPQKKTARIASKGSARDVY